MISAELETVAPANWSTIYLSRGEEIPAHRPIFTGDVFQLGSQCHIVVQHPCALRTNGVDLVDRILVAQVEACDSIPGSWTGHTRQAFLPELQASVPDEHYSAHFRELNMLNEADLGKRTACLSLVGVNILLQRWVHHNSRIVVPTFEMNQVVVGPYEECDITEEWRLERTTKDRDIRAATVECHNWLRKKPSDSDRTRQDLLDDAQYRAAVRREALAHCRELNSKDPATN